MFFGADRCSGRTLAVRRSKGYAPDIFLKWRSALSRIQRGVRNSPRMDSHKPQTAPQGRTIRTGTALAYEWKYAFGFTFCDSGRAWLAFGVLSPVGFAALADGEP
jgi:hypothetical protein